MRAPSPSELYIIYSKEGTRGLAAHLGREQNSKWRVQEMKADDSTDMVVETVNTFTAFLHLRPSDRLPISDSFP